MSGVLQVAVDAIGLGSLYALTALGIALIFGIMRLINFAHGEIVMLAGFTMLFVAGFGSLPLIVLTVIAGAAVGIAMERLAFRPVRAADTSTLLITSFALSFLIKNAGLMSFGSIPRPVELPAIVSETIVVAGIRIQVLTLLTIGSTAVLLTSLAAFLRRTTIGIQIRGASEDFLMTRLLGVRANRVISGAFAISGLLAGVVALIVVSQTGSVNPQMGLALTLIGFVATVVGGLGSLPAAAAGGFALGLVTVSLQVYLPLELRSFRDAFVFAVVFFVLLLRPHGLLRSGAIERGV